MAFHFQVEGCIEGEFRAVVLTPSLEVDKSRDIRHVGFGLLHKMISERVS